MIEFAIVLNILLFLGIIVGQILTKFKAKPKIIAMLISFMCAVISLYVLLMLAIGLQSLFAEKFFIAISLFGFGIAPFVIGTIATYKRANLFIFLQQFIFILSLIALFKLLG